MKGLAAARAVAGLAAPIIPGLTARFVTRLAARAMTWLAARAVTRLAAPAVTRFAARAVTTLCRNVGCDRSLRDRLRQPNSDRGADTFLALDRQLTTMAIDDVLDDGEAQTRAAGGS